jgi:hypothetical protein
VPNVLEKRVPLFAIVSELVAQDAEGTRGVAEPAGHLMGLTPFDEKGSKGFILSVQGLFGAQKEPDLRGVRYPIAMIGSHAFIMLPSSIRCQHIVCPERKTTR